MVEAADNASFTNNLLLQNTLDSLDSNFNILKTIIINCPNLAPAEVIQEMLQRLSAQANFALQTRSVVSIDLVLQELNILVSNVFEHFGINGMKIIKTLKQDLHNARDHLKKAAENLTLSALDILDEILYLFRSSNDKNRERYNYEKKEDARHYQNDSYSSSGDVISLPSQQQTQEPLLLEPSAVGNHALQCLCVDRKEKPKLMSPRENSNKLSSINITNKQNADTAKKKQFEKNYQIGRIEEIRCSYCKKRGHDNKACYSLKRAIKTGEVTKEELNTFNN